MIDYRVSIARTLDDESPEEGIELSASSISEAALQGLKANGGGFAECIEAYAFGYRVARSLSCSLADGQLVYDVRYP